MSQLKLGAFFAQDPFKAFFCSQSLSFSLSGLQKLLSVFPKGFFAQEHFQLIDKCRQQRKTYNTDFFLGDTVSKKQSGLFGIWNFQDLHF